MSLSLVHLISFVLYIVSTSAYWLSQNRLQWHKASSYCISHCKSRLASIHSLSDDTEAQNVINNDPSITDSAWKINVWIGLYTSTGAAPWIWSDLSIFDYGNTYLTPPWSSAPIDNNGYNCINYYYPPTTIRWAEADCAEPQRFLCNSCQGVLDKYMMYHTSYTYTTASSHCTNTLGTSLATISNSEDFVSSQLICQIDAENCWIGLNRLNNEGSLIGFHQFEWVDGTSFSSSLDFGYGTTGITPWGSQAGTQPNNVGGDQYCIEIEKTESYEWNDEACSEWAHTLCNKPSELFYPSYWSNIYSPHTDYTYNNAHAISADSGTAVISNKRWTNSNWPLIIEHMFFINSNNVNNMAYSGLVGVVIYHKQNANGLNGFDVCDQIFIGIEIESGNQAFAVYRQYKNEVSVSETRSSSTIFSVDSTKLYRLNIKLVNDNPSGYINLCFKIQGIMATQLCAIDIYSVSTSDDYVTSPKYIGITNDNVAVTHKSLYISGTPQYNYGSLPLGSCTLSPTTSPTPAPTANPTINPTNDPTNDPTTDPTKDPTSDPTNDPTTDPTAVPTTDPTFDPTTDPTTDPTFDPTNDPTTDPTAYPTNNPSLTPTRYPTNEPTMIPTNTPSMEPTFDPTVKPSNVPTRSFQVNKYGVKISITFKYKLNTNLTDNQIDAMFTNITKEIIAETTREYKNCIASQYYNISISNINDKTTINATVFVCDDTTQNALNADFSNNLESDFIDKSKERVSLEINSTIIGISSLFEEQEGSASDITTTKYATNNNNPSREENFIWPLDIMLSIYIGIGLFILLLLICIIICIYYKKKNGNLKKEVEIMSGSEVMSGSESKPPIKLNEKDSIPTTSHIYLHENMNVNLNVIPIKQNNAMTVTPNIIYQESGPDARTLSKSSAFSTFAETPGNDNFINENGSASDGNINNDDDDDDDDDDLYAINNENNHETPMGPVTDDGMHDVVHHQTLR